MGKLSQFREAKSALLHYYSSNRDSHGVRLIGFTAGLFTLIQIVQNSKKEPLSGIFTKTSVILGGIPPSYTEAFKLLVFFAGNGLLLFFIIRSIFRFAVFGYLSEFTLAVNSDETFERAEAIHMAIHKIVEKKIVSTKKKLYGVFPLRWFVSTGKDSEHWKGYSLCVFLAVGFTFLLISILW